MIKSTPRKPKSLSKLSREACLRRIETLKKNRTPGWQKQGIALCNRLGDLDHLPYGPTTTQEETL
jgi:hypothetical protein